MAEKKMRKRVAPAWSLDLDPKDIPKGKSYEWKRVSVFGETKVGNLDNKEYFDALKMDGWRPVPQRRHPRFLVKLDGLVLCERSLKLTARAKKEQHEIAVAQVKWLKPETQFPTTSPLGIRGLMSEAQRNKFAMDWYKFCADNRGLWGREEDHAYPIPNRFWQWVAKRLAPYQIKEGPAFRTKAWVKIYRVFKAKKWPMRWILTREEIDHAPFAMSSLVDGDVYERYAYHKHALIMEHRIGDAPYPTKPSIWQRASAPFRRLIQRIKRRAK